jgi:hypothetical protein
MMKLNAASSDVNKERFAVKKAPYSMIFCEINQNAHFLIVLASQKGEISNLLLIALGTRNPRDGFRKSEQFRYSTGCIEPVDQVSVKSPIDLQLQPHLSEYRILETRLFE